MKHFNNLTFSKKYLCVYPPKFLMTLLRSESLEIFNPPCFHRIDTFPHLFSSSPIVYISARLFSLNFCPFCTVNFFFLPPILTMMHLCMQYTYWTPLLTTLTLALNEKSNCRFGIGTLRISIDSQHDPKCRHTGNYDAQVVRRIVYLKLRAV